MRGLYETKISEAKEIERRLCQQPPTDDARVIPRKFGAVAKMLWPFKTAAHLAAIAGKDERHAARWLSGEYEPPGSVIAAVIVEMLKTK